MPEWPHSERSRVTTTGRIWGLGVLRVFKKDFETYVYILTVITEIQLTSLWHEYSGLSPEAGFSENHVTCERSDVKLHIEDELSEEL